LQVPVRTGRGAAPAGNQSAPLDIIARVIGVTFGSATAQGDRRMKRRTWVLGLVVLGGVGWYLFRPELLFVNTKVNEGLVTASASTAASEGATATMITLTGRFHLVAHETKALAS